MKRGAANFWCCHQIFESCPGGAIKFYTSNFQSEREREIKGEKGGERGIYWGFLSTINKLKKENNLIFFMWLLSSLHPFFLSYISNYLRYKIWRQMYQSDSTPIIPSTHPFPETYLLWMKVPVLNSRGIPIKICLHHTCHACSIALWDLIRQHW